MPHYEYPRPTTLDQARELMAATPGARFIAGGTDLLVQLRKQRLPEPPALISLRNIEALASIHAEGEVRIGSGALLTDIAMHPAVRAHFPALVASIDALGSRQIRNVATLAGNLCNASPAADAAPPLLVYEARVEVIGPGGARAIPIDEFFTGPGQTSLADGEVVTAIAIAAPAAGASSTFMRKGRVKMDLAIASVAVLLQWDGTRCTRARVAAGSVAPTPLRLPEVEGMLEGSSLDDQTIERAAGLARAAIRPITDLRSTADYRRALVGVYVKRAIASLRGGAS